MTVFVHPVIYAADPISVMLDTKDELLLMDP